MSTLCNLQVGGWDFNSRRIYVRPQAVAQWWWLQRLAEAEPAYRVLMLEGTGTGKSTVIWAWACYHAQHGPVVWGHRVRGGSSVIALLGGGLVSYYTVRAEHREDLVNSLERIAEWAGADVMILDGLRNNDADVGLRDSAQLWATEAGYSRRRAVTVSSAQMPAVDVNYRHQMYRRETLYSWTKEEFDNACGDADLWNQVKANMDWVVPADRDAQDDSNVAEFERNGGRIVAMEEDDEEDDGEDAYNDHLRKRKFRMAGHSARWMLSLNYDELVYRVHQATEELPQYEDLANGLHGYRNNFAVNRCVAVFRAAGGPARVRIISTYVGQLVAQQCELAFFNNATIRNLNPAFNGWVLEGEFLCRVRLAEDDQNNGNSYVTVYEAGNRFTIDHVQLTELRLAVGVRIFFDRDLSEIGSVTVEDNTWFIPRRWNQGGYDVALYRAEQRCLFCLQITTNQNHDETWTHMNKLAWAVTRRLVAQAMAAAANRDPAAANPNPAAENLPNNHFDMNVDQRTMVQQHGVQFVEYLLVRAASRPRCSWRLRVQEQRPNWRYAVLSPHAHAHRCICANCWRPCAASQPQPDYSITGQDGGLYAREPDNHDWRRNFPLRPE